MSYPQLLSPEELLADAKKRLGLPVIVCLCGSTRFWKELGEAAWDETLNGHIVLRPEVNLKHPGLAYGDSTGVKAELDKLHRAKIRTADEVLVVNPGGYVGDSTGEEIAYARQLGKPVRYTHPMPEAPALLRDAATRLRRLVTATEADMVENAYWGNSPTSASYTAGVENALGGPAGELAGAMHPSLCKAVAAILDAQAERAESGAQPEGEADVRQALEVARYLLGVDPEPEPATAGTGK
jgi:hypothetical protein